MLETLLGSRLRAKVLGWLFSHPDERYFVRQLTALVKEDSTNVSRELARLEKTGILVTTTEGKQKYYQANRQSPIFNELHGLILKTVGVADIIKKALEPRMADIKLAFIFGSVAKRAENRFSDIDLLVVGDITFGEVVDLISTAEGALNRELNPVVYTLAEFNKRLSENHYFIRDILSGDKIFVVGDENELKSLVGKGLAKGT
ncbi:MAG TPA: nucleotidyltransferase domain-containing protein [Dehalococcoidia bacterium]